MPQTDASLGSWWLPKSWVLAEILGFDGRTGLAWLEPIRGKYWVGYLFCRDAPSPNFFLLRFSGLCFVQRYFVVQDSEFSALTVSFRFINGY